ncbi:response regulator [Bacteroides caecigallinarum]|uniref:hybrid sensor histidine kinase/response regulator transcription factor n=1 Tax=Bacteroides caecigallinarum TaxID=1411144 RepID=UPI00195D6A33|nr:two-component regulator propeller domain-containing protein [Bacteroides caecigallinarum]MBM6889124.1 response regulator [Bacteroides caecigallinarum]
MKYILYILFFIGTFLMPCHAQYSRLFTIGDGLSSSLINNIYQDSRGYIWISTRDGLNRYDGAKVVKYKPLKNDSTTLLSNNVSSVYEDSVGHIFVLSNKGLQTYDYATDKFKTLALSDSRYNNKCIFGGYDKSLLIGTSGYGIKSLKFDSDGNAIIETLDNDYNGFNVNSMIDDNEGNLWIATESHGLIMRKKDGNECIFFKDKANPALSPVNLCVKDNYGNIYVSLLTDGAYVYDKQNNKFNKIYSAFSPVTSMIQRGDALLIGTDGDGIVSYNIKTKEISKAEILISDTNLAESKIHSIITDNYGNLWIGIYQKGVAFVPFKTDEFNYIGYRSTRKNNIGDKSVTAIECNENGDYLIGTDNDGLYLLDNEFNLIRHFSPRSMSSNVPNTVMCVYRDSDNRIWIGSYLNGLSYLDKDNQRFNHVSFEKNGFYNVDRVYSITEDNERRLWIGTMGSGLFYIDLSAPNIISEHLYDTNLNESLNKWINSLYYSRDDNVLYICTVDDVRCLDVSTGKYIKTTPISKGGTITSINQDIKGNIWVGTMDGLKVFNNKLESLLDEYDVADGLPSNNIASVILDDSGNVWVSTSMGIVKFDETTHKFVSFSASGGSYNNEFSMGASYKDEQGNLYFGGTSGIVYFNPDKIKFEPMNCNVRITAFYLHNEAVNQSTMSGHYNVLDNEISKAKEINLTHSDNYFAIEFATDNYSISHDFEYSINNGVWNSVQQGVSRVYFSNLPVGKYKFMVRCKNASASSSVRTLYINIHPVWYMTLPAQIIYIILILSIIAFVLYQVKLKYLARQEMLKHKMQEEANEAKLQFFINISHEIRTPMSLILSPLHKLISTDNDSERQKNYSLIERNAERILNLINQLMDIRKIDKQQMKLRFSEVEVISFIKDLKDLFAYQADSKGVKVNVVSEMERLYVWLDPNNFDKIIFNMLSNSFKHIPECGEINIYVKSGTDNSIPYPLNNYVEIKIEDNGTGIKESEIEHIFERFYQITDDETYTRGTGIGLHLTMSLVKLHYGTISVANNVGKPGCHFIIRIPLGNSHLKEEEKYIHAAVQSHKVSDDIKYVAEETKEKTVKKNVRKKYTVLVVDDDDEVRNYLLAELGGMYKTIACSNGKQALDIIMSASADIVLSDIMMPEMDGMSLLRKIKQNINTNHIPVVLLTAKNTETDNIEGLSFGADAYLTKPFNIDIVKITIENLLKNREVLRNNYSGNQEQASNVVCPMPESADDKLMKKVMKAITDNISNPELNVEMIASQVGISRVHLYRKLKELTNQSTRDFIRNIRLKQAATMLTSEKNYNVSEIAMAVGFSNATYFSNAFKELYGVSPSKYAELHNQMQS